MKRPTLAELERRCQKPDYRHIGNWMARRVTRPAALRLTWVILPLGLSANTITVAAWLTALCACGGLMWGSPDGWLIGAALLQLWYLLDHVDGQLARFHGTASLDGVQLDYLMHHCVNLLVPVSLGYGLAAAAEAPAYAIAGLPWGVSLLMIGLIHDARYKAFVQRLKRVRGELIVVGGGGARPQPQPPVPRRLLPAVGWLMRKSCEPHVTMNAVTALAALRYFVPSLGLPAAMGYLVAMSLLAPMLFVALLMRSARRQAAEHEFCQWFRVPPEHELVFRDGWWLVEPPRNDDAVTWPTTAKQPYGGE